MPKKKKSQPDLRRWGLPTLLDLKALSDTQGTEPPTEFRLLAYGVTRTTKGDVLFDERSAGLVEQANKDYGNDISIDYEHQAVRYEGTGPVPAAGWCKLDVRDDAEGHPELWAVNVEWTDRAAQLLCAREYRYYSPVYYLDAEGRVVEVVNIALTNLPATKDMTPLMASQITTAQETTDMTPEEMKAAMAEALGAFGAELLSQIQALMPVPMPEADDEVTASQTTTNDDQVAQLVAKNVELLRDNEALEQQVLLASLIAHGAPADNPSRVADLALLVKASRKPEQTLYDAVKDHAAANPDLYSPAKQPVQHSSKPLPAQAIKALSKPVTTTDKPSKFEQYKSLPKARSPFIGGK